MDDESEKPDRIPGTASSDGPDGRLDLGIVLLAAAVPRLFGLGHVSLWLDEILSTLRVGSSLPETWRACQSDSVHPPLSELLMWFWFRAVDSEPLRRLLPIAMGVLTVVLIWRLACRWFGRRAAMATAWIAAWSPLHVRYSQELRAYSLGLLALVLALAACDRALERRGWSGWAVLGLALSLCYWSLYTTGIVLAPVVITVVQTAAGRSTRRRDLAGLAFALLLSLALFSPWFSVVRSAAAKVHELEATDWNLALAGSRWQFLTVGGVEGAALSTGALVFAVLIAAGTLAALTGARGRSVVAGALAGTVGVEVVLKLADHWSSGRYDLVSWPFLVLLAGLGCAAASDLVTRLFRAAAARKGARLLRAAIAAAPLLSLLVFQTFGLADYFRRGRPDWESVARAVSAAARPNRPILTSNEWTRISVGYYLSRLEGAPEARISPRPRVVEAGGGLASIPSRGCSVVVDSSSPTPPALRAALLATPAQLRFPRSGARVAASAADRGEGRPADPWRCLPRELDSAGERPAPWLLRRAGSARGGKERLLEMSGEESGRLLFGWSYPERTPEGMTFRWAVGHWAAIELGACPARTLAVTLWSLSEDQTLTLYRARRRLAGHRLSSARQTLEVPLPAGFGAAPEVLTFGFSRYASPQENPRPLAVGFDRIELVP